MQIATLGIDIGKVWFHVVGVDATGKPVFREKLCSRHIMTSRSLYAQTTQAAYGGGP